MPLHHGTQEEGVVTCQCFGGTSVEMGGIIDKNQPSSLFHLGIRLKKNAFDGKLEEYDSTCLKLKPEKGV